MQQPNQQAKTKAPIYIDMFTTIPAGTLGTFEEDQQQNRYKISIAGQSLQMSSETFDNTFIYYKQSKLF